MRAVCTKCGDEYSHADELFNPNNLCKKHWIEEIRLKVTHLDDQMSAEIRDIFSKYEELPILQSKVKCLIYNSISSANDARLIYVLCRDSIGREGTRRFEETYDQYN